MVLRHHRLILALALVATVIAGFLASKLRVDSDLRRLLPRDHPVVVYLEKIERSFGSTGSVNVVVKDGTPEARHAFTRALAERLQGNPLLRDVDYRLPSDFFAERALYYLSSREMKELDERIDAWLHYEFCSEAPDNCLTEPDPDAPQALEDFVDAKREEALDRTGFHDMYEREGIDANVILLHPVEPAASLEFAHEVSDEMRRITQEVFETRGAQWSETGMTYNIVGPYINKSDEHRIIRRDTVRAGAFAISGVVLILGLLFRSQRAVLVLLVPLACGVVWALAATYLVVGDLNAMTSLISTVVMGAGIDAGIHFYVRVSRERRKHDDAEAIRRAFGGLIVPLLVASSTTVGAFAIMAVSKFPAFREFGIIAAMGVALCLLAMVTVLPALSYLVGIKQVRRPPRARPSAAARMVLARPGPLLVVVAVLSALAVFPARQVRFEFDGRALQSDHTRKASDADVHLISKIFGRDIHAGILVRPTLEATRITLDHAREVLQRDKAEGTSVVAELFAAPDLLPDPGIDQQVRKHEIEDLLEIETIEELEDIAGIEYKGPRKAVEDAIGADDAWVDEGETDGWADDSDGAGTGGDAAAGGDDPVEAAPPPAVDPPEDPPAAEDSPAAEDPPPDDGERQRLTKEDAATLLHMLEAQPFGLEDLPRVLRERVRADDGEFGVFAYPDFDAADMRKGVEFMRETASFLPPGEEGMFVGETTVYAAMFLMLREEAPIVLALAAVLVALLVFWQLRSIKQALMTLLPLALAFWWLVAIMGLIDLRFTLFNLPILPAILGIGVDNGVYLTDRLRRSTGEVDDLIRSLQETGGAIMAAMATTAVGFAAFMIADSAGVRGIGAVAVLGIVLAGVAATLVLPALSGVRHRARRRRGSATP